MLLDRYVLKQFVTALIFSLIALPMLFILIDLLERMDDFLDNKTPILIVVRYYLVFLPNIYTLIVPICVLLASLFSIGRLARNNEVLSMRAGGQSLTRFMMPLLLFAITLSCAQLWFNGWVVPAANTHKLDLERQYLASHAGRSALYKLYFRDIPTRNVSIDFYDTDTQTARQVVIETFSSERHPRIVTRIEAPTMKWNTARGGWVVPLGKRQEFRGDTMTQATIADVTVPFTVRHDQIVRLQKNIDELSLDELRDYIETLKKGGKNTRAAEIDYFGRWAFPFASVIVILLAVPFATVKRKGGVAVHIAMAMGSTFAYIAFTKISQAIGVGIAVHPAYIAWSANAIFLAIGLVIVARTRT